MWQDVRQAVRTLAKNPGFTALAAAVLGLGIGLNVAAARMNLLPWLANGGVAVKSGRRRARLAITIPQVALSLALLLVGIACIRALLRTETADLGSYTNRKVAIISSGLAQRLWPGRDPVGQQLTAVNSWNGFKDRIDWFDVIGVVAEVGPILHEGSRPTAYFSLGQEWRPSASTIVARGHGDSRTLLPALKAAVTSSESFADVTRTTTLQQLVASILYPRRIADAVLSISGAVALFLAIVGIYGVVSYSVAQRTGEIGVRMALGADRRDIVRLVLADGVRIAAAGSLVGLVLGYASAQATSNRYLSLPPLDVVTLLITPLALGAVNLLACYVPARRAGLTDPLSVLRRS